MRHFLSGFADELTKQASAPPHQPPQPQARDYVRSAIVTAATVPLLAIVGKTLSRALHNREVSQAMERTFSPLETHRLKAELETGPLIGRPRFDLPRNERPAFTASDLGSDVVKGALMGSVIQMIRDRFVNKRPNQSR